MSRLKLIISFLVGAVIGAALMVVAVNLGFVAATQTGITDATSPDRMSLVMQGIKGAGWGGILGVVIGILKQ